MINDNIKKNTKKQFLLLNNVTHTNNISKIKLLYNNDKSKSNEILRKEQYNSKSNNKSQKSQKSNKSQKSQKSKSKACLESASFNNYNKSKVYSQVSLANNNNTKKKSLSLKCKDINN